MNYTPHEPFPEYNQSFCTFNNLLALEPFRVWCYKTLPLTYDDSLSYYETLSKFQDTIQRVVDNEKKVTDSISCLTDLVQGMQTYFNTFIENFNTAIAQLELNLFDVSYNETLQRINIIKLHEG